MSSHPRFGDEQIKENRWFIDEKSSIDRLFPFCLDYQKPVHDQKTDAGLNWW
ncbi:MAG: hypothetical protein L7U72_09790 [Rubripirellula sp.]|nr:hypothetical protein [Rubripirellula sp.]